MKLKKFRTWNSKEAVVNLFKIFSQLYDTFHMILPLNILFCYWWEVCKLIKISIIASAFGIGKTETEPVTFVKALCPSSSPKYVLSDPAWTCTSQGAPCWCELGCHVIRPSVKNSRNPTCKSLLPQRDVSLSWNKIVWMPFWTKAMN